MPNILVTHLLHPIFSFFAGSPVAGEMKEYPLRVLAVPGLMTMLDVALFHAVEGQLTATTYGGRALLQAWLDLKQQARLVLAELKPLFPTTSTTNNNNNDTNDTNSSAVESEQRRRWHLAESFARLCLEAGWDATERMGTDKLAQSANLSDPYDTGTFASGGGGGSNHVLSGVGVVGIVNGVLDSKEETGRRFPSEQRGKDCWESARLFCPDYVWADDVILTCQRLLRNITKHPFYSDDAVTLVGTTQRGRLAPVCERLLSILLELVKDDIPVRLHQFKAAVEADSVVSKRLYLVKCEYRAPFRAFLEAHQSVQRAPTVAMVDDYLSMKPAQIKQKREEAQDKLQKLLETPDLLQSLALERACEEVEIEMAKALFPFTEMARIIEHKKARLLVVTGLMDGTKVIELQDLLRVSLPLSKLVHVYLGESSREKPNTMFHFLLLLHYLNLKFQRLRYLLCRRAGPETSTGIRPLLLDIRGMPRDDDPYPSIHTTTSSSNSLPKDMDPDSLRRLDTLVDNLKLLGTLIKTKNAFHTDKRSDVDFPLSVSKGCSEDFDSELFHCQVQDFFAIVRRQRTIVEDRKPYSKPLHPRSHIPPPFSTVEALESKIRSAEMEMSLAVASNQSLQMVRQRLEVIVKDRHKKFDVLKQMVEEVCLREMNLHVRLDPPHKDRALVLTSTSALGVFGDSLRAANEPLPLG